ncbi:MAG: sigma 54-interacting transcriptional regulator [Bryobacteraceae bacterium]
MPFLSGQKRAFLHAVSQLAYCNPFLPERMEFERAALGSSYVEGEPVWSLPVDEPERPRANVWRVVERLDPLMEQLRRRLPGAGDSRAEDLALYEDGAIHLLYQRYYPQFFAAGIGRAKSTGGRWHFYKDFLAGWRHFFEIDGLRLPTGHDPRHIFTCFRQIQRAFEQIFRDIIGASMPAARLRAAIWQSIFTHDMRRYRRTLFARMGDFTTLITGPSGTGKELAARAIAQSRYVPFDTQRLAFADDEVDTFFAINISALSPALVESELFGHRRGAFTGAAGDRKGWLETCTALGSVFLDELGDLDPAIQVKLLRVIETRTFHPVGDTAGREFRGKLIAATNRDLAAGMRNGKFREDLYYRLCSDQIATPSLADQLADCPGVLRDLTVYMTRRLVGAEEDSLTEEVIGWIERNLEPNYPWPGNYRELDQCVKNVLIRRDYHPSRWRTGDAAENFQNDFRAGRLTAETLLSHYCTLVYSKTGSYEETARRTGLDRRTVKSKIDAGFLARLQREA